MGLFHFPLNELAGWALNNMGMVILGFMLTTPTAALAFLPFLLPVPQTSTVFSITMGTFFSLLPGCILVLLFLPASLLEEESDLRPHLLTPKTPENMLHGSLGVLNLPEMGFGKLSRQVLCPSRASLLCRAASL